jgi:hypothetical protein
MTDIATVGNSQVNQPQPFFAGDRWTALAVLSLAVLGAYLSWTNFWYAYDDAFITYRVAYNLASGHGFVYNVGERVLVTTAPLYGLVLGGLGWLFGPDRIPFFGAWLSATSFTLIALALYDYSRLHGQALAGWLAGYFFLTTPVILDVFGGEMLVLLALGLWAFVCYARGCRRTSVVLLALATLVRPDGVLAAVVLFAYDALRSRRVPWREGLLFGAVVVPFALAAWIYYGSPLPMTLSSKIGQRESNLWLTFGRGMREWLTARLTQGVRGPRFQFFALDPGTFCFWLTVGVPALLFYRFWWLPLSWIALFLVCYWRLKVPFYHWYAAPALVALAMMAASGVGGAVALAWLALPRMGTKPAAGAAIVLALAATGPGLPAATKGRWPIPGIAPYEEVGRWLQANTPADSSVAYYEIGYLGYYSRRRIIDPMGLLDPAIVPHVARRDFLWPYEHYRPTYILELASVTLMHPFKAQPWFSQEYRFVRTFSAAGGEPGGMMTLWERHVAR